MAQFNDKHMEELVLLKIGGSVITDVSAPDTARYDAITRLANEIKLVHAEGTKLIVGHGSGSFGHVTAHKYQTHKGLIHAESRKGAALTQNVAANLHRLVIKGFCNAGLNPFSFPPSGGALSAQRKIKEWNLNAMKDSLMHGFLPVTYGDVVIDKELGITVVSTEEALRFIAEDMKPEKIIIGGDTDGVYSADPKLNAGAKLIPVVDGSNIDEVLAGAGGSTKVDVTGGMKNKLEQLYGMCKSTGATGQIVNISVPSRLFQALSGIETAGTIIKA